MKKAIRYGRTDRQTDGRTYPNNRKASLLKKIKVMCDRVRTLRFFQKDNMQIFNMLVPLASNKVIIALNLKDVY